MVHCVVSLDDVYLGRRLLNLTKVVEPLLGDALDQLPHLLTVVFLSES